MEPKFFTHAEGGNWYSWPKRVKLPAGVLEMKGRTQVLIAGFGYVHALAFGNPYIIGKQFPRWDSLNGWTNKPKELKEPRMILSRTLVEHMALQCSEHAMALFGMIESVREEAAIAGENLTPLEQSLNTKLDRVKNLLYEASLELRRIDKRMKDAECNMGDAE
jgi:hypothetical protein